MDNKSAHIDHELSMWKKQIDGIMSRIETLPSGKKAKIMALVGDIRILATELDDRIERVKESGYDGGDFWVNDVKVDIDEFRSDFTETAGTYMDYDYSG